MSEEDPGPVPIDIVGDIVSVPCFLGLRLVNAVVSSVPGLAVDIRWYPFQIAPDLPPEGMDRAAYLAQTYGADQVEAVLAQEAESAREFGLELALDRITHQPNTFLAHRLIRFAYGFGVQTQIVERLFQAFFLQGLDIGDRAVLIALAAKSRLDPAAVEAFFAQGADIELLEKEMSDIRHAGVSQVPRFTFAGKEDIIGLQPADIFADALFNSIEG
ncbi:DsbA family oxidoreductase [Beijerinckia indica]|uniref:DSBA oxidoreductase n=1 Tax=Beijerinckia indica subsp. indica (strain ATCC 9039 / DSM 1715 / NCIMB 8712) TaxID=395963 RepID=B2IGQ4_BEII9|nr:DsbA family oxidoreductase [Beijerinckia indica]ACB95815.1 DSBA oxidoreductase [Beijerinckia indica subsp. indica ATCC 9039]